jgi:hypothetical protein
MNSHALGDIDRLCKAVLKRGGQTLLCLEEGAEAQSKLAQEGKDETLCLCPIRFYLANKFK